MSIRSDSFGNHSLETLSPRPARRGFFWPELVSNISTVFSFVAELFRDHQIILFLDLSTGLVDARIVWSCSAATHCDCHQNLLSPEDVPTKP